MKRIFKAIISVILTLLFALSPALLLVESNAGEGQVITFSLEATEVPEDGGDFDVYVSVSSNPGFYSEVLYIVYPDFLSVKSAEALYDKDDPFSESFALYTENDVILRATSVASVNDRLREAAVSSGFSESVGSIDDMIPSTHKAANITLISSQSTDENGNTQNHQNLKPVSSPLAHYVFTYDPSNNPSGKAEFPIYLICSAANAKRIISSDDGTTESFSPQALSTVASGHDYEVISTVDPTCTENGISHLRCKKCANEITEELLASGHDYELTMFIKPQVDVCGKKIYTCTKCSSEYEELIPAYVYMRGDVDGNGQVNLLDVKELKKLILGSISSNDIVAKNADVDCNGQINALDVKEAKKLVLYGE